MLQIDIEDTIPVYIDLFGEVVEEEKKWLLTSDSIHPQARAL